jgi:hypothetical protein
MRLAAEHNARQLETAWELCEEHASIDAAIGWAEHPDGAPFAPAGPDAAARVGCRYLLALHAKTRGGAADAHDSLTSTARLAITGSHYHWNRNVR